jgi:Fe-S-cluster-containing hydrogenase component 2
MNQTGFVKTHFDLCTGCSLCQLACSQRLAGGYNPHRAVLAIRHESENLYHFPVVCEQCQNAYCMNSCPVGAISVNEATGAKVVNLETCVGCGTCAKFCPIGVIHVDPEIKKSRKCDLCDGQPLCVAACPTGALEFICPPPEANAGGDCHA